MTRLAHEAGRRLLRDKALDVAGEQVVRQGWDSLQMRGVAVQLGISRQTLYNAFGDRHGLAEALVRRLLERFLHAVDVAVEDADADLRAQWEAVVRATLELAANEELLSGMLTGTSRVEFLPLLTSEAAPIIRRARHRLVALFLRHHADLDASRLAPVAELVTRLCLSHIVLPTDSSSEVAKQVGRMAESLLSVPRVAV